MKLIGSYTSPFVRKIFILLLEKQLTFEFVNDNPNLDGSRVPDVNPLGKVPALVADDGEIFFDSPIVADYIDRLTETPRFLPLDWERALRVRQTEALADGICDAAVTIVKELRRPAEHRDEHELQRQRDKILRGLDELERSVAAGRWIGGAEPGRYRRRLLPKLSQLPPRLSQLVRWPPGVSTPGGAPVSARQFSAHRAAGRLGCIPVPSAFIMGVLRPAQIKVRNSSMSSDHQALYSQIPAIDTLLRTPTCAALQAQYGSQLVTQTLRSLQQQARHAVQRQQTLPDWCADWGVACTRRLAETLRPALRQVFNLTGTVLHTNLGRALLPDPAIVAAAEAMSAPVTLEYDLDDAGRGHRDRAIADRLCALTGAEDACIVNNNGRAGGDRRRVPYSRRHDPGRMPSARGRHHQPYPPARLPPGH